MNAIWIAPIILFTVILVLTVILWRRDQKRMAATRKAPDRDLSHQQEGSAQLGSLRTIYTSAAAAAGGTTPTPDRHPNRWN